VSYTNGTDTVASTNAVPLGLWSVITVVCDAGTIYHYLNGVANGSGAASGASNAFAALRIGYDGSNYYDGRLSAFVAYNTAKSSTQNTAITNTLAQRLWDYRQLPARGVTAVDFTIAPSQ